MWLHECTIKHCPFLRQHGAGSGSFPFAPSHSGNKYQFNFRSNDTEHHPTFLFQSSSSICDSIYLLVVFASNDSFEAFVIAVWDTVAAKWTKMWRCSLSKCKFLSTRLAMGHFLFDPIILFHTCSESIASIMNTCLCDGDTHLKEERGKNTTSLESYLIKLSCRRGMKLDPINSACVTGRSLPNLDFFFCFFLIASSPS